jgi:starvation-inducible DNA-binding protein
MTAADSRITGMSTGLSNIAVGEISSALRALIADMYALYLKTKNFHWHASGPHIRDHRLLLNEQTIQILTTVEMIAERTRKLGSHALHSIGHIVRLRRILDNDADYVAPAEMLAELRDDNIQIAACLRDAHELCEEHGDIATSKFLRTWLDEAEGRVWLLIEAGRNGTTSC